MSTGTSRNPTPQNGYAIRAFREREGLSVNQLASTIGVSDSHMRNLECENKAATPEVLARIADAVHVPVVALSRIRGSEMDDNRARTRRAAVRAVA